MNEDAFLGTLQGDSREESDIFPFLEALLRNIHLYTKQLDNYLVALIILHASRPPSSRKSSPLISPVTHVLASPTLGPVSALPSSTHAPEAPVTTSFALASPSLLAVLVDSTALPESPLILSEHSTFIRLNWVMRNRPTSHHDLTACRFRFIVQPTDLPLLAGLEPLAHSLTLHDPYSRSQEVERSQNRASPLYEVESLFHLPPLVTRLDDLSPSMPPASPQSGSGGGVMRPLSLMTSLVHLDLSEAMHLARSVLLNHFHAGNGLHLRDLNLAGCVLSKEILTHVADVFPGLTALNLTNCQDVSDGDMEVVGRLRNLRALSLAFCTSLTDKGTPHLAPLVHLERLSLKGCAHLHDDSILVLTQALTNLTDLDLSNNAHISAQGLAGLDKLQRLRVLFLRCCVRVTDAAAPYLQKLTTLEEVDLSACWSVGVETLRALRGMPALRTVRVPGALDEQLRLILPEVTS